MSAPKHTRVLLEVDSFRPCLTMFAQTARHQLFGPDDSRNRESNSTAYALDEAIAHRLRDCWNACEGLADPSVVPELLSALKDLVALVRKVAPAYAESTVTSNAEVAIAKAEDK